MVTSDFAHSVGAVPYFMMVVIGSATPEREAAYRRYVRYMTWKPGLDQCCTRFTRCLCITPRASSHAAWSVACSGSVQRLCVVCYTAVLKSAYSSGKTRKVAIRGAGASRDGPGGLKTGVLRQFKVGFAAKSEVRPATSSLAVK
jgi:hypothetical protein